MRATISEIGPTLLGRILELNDTQEGVLEIVFKLADDSGWLLLDLDDLRALLDLVADNRKDISAQYGLVSAHVDRARSSARCCTLGAAGRRRASSASRRSNWPT